MGTSAVVCIGFFGKELGPAAGDRLWNPQVPTRDSIEDDFRIDQVN